MRTPRTVEAKYRRSMTPPTPSHLSNGSYSSSAVVGCMVKAQEASPFLIAADMRDMYWLFLLCYPLLKNAACWIALEWPVRVEDFGNLAIMKGRES